MSVKTITIDLEAYDLLAAKKQKGESFSRTLKRLLAEGDSTAEGLLRDLPRIALAGETLDRLSATEGTTGPTNRRETGPRDDARHQHLRRPSA
jgi:negative regulator of replication initiation